jgi:hypothetical protein
MNCENALLCVFAAEAQLTQVKALPSPLGQIVDLMPQLEAINGSSGHPFRPIAAGQVDLAYPLVRETYQSLSLSDWREYARRLIDKDEAGPWQRGISVAEGPRNHLRGLFSHHLSPHPEDGDRLSIDCIALPDALGRASVVRSLVRAFDELASDHGCQVVSVHLTPGTVWLQTVFEELGSKTHIVVSYERVSGG